MAGICNTIPADSPTDCAVDSELARSRPAWHSGAARQEVAGGQHTNGRSARTSACRRALSTTAIGVTGAILVAATWHFRVCSNIKEDELGAGRETFGTGISRRAALLGRGKPGQQYGWLDSFALGAGVTPQQENGPTWGRDAQQMTLRGHQDLIWEPRAQTHPPHHAGTWSFRGVYPHFRESHQMDTTPTNMRLAEEEDETNSEKVEEEANAAEPAKGEEVNNDERSEQQGRPRVESAPYEHETDWTFSNYFGPKPVYKDPHQQEYHNPAHKTITRSWECYFLGSCEKEERVRASTPTSQPAREPPAPPPARKAWPDQVHEDKQSVREGSDKVWMSALCSVGVISVIVVYVSLDYHVDDIDVP